MLCWKQLIIIINGCHSVCLYLEAVNEFTDVFLSLYSLVLYQEENSVLTLNLMFISEL